MHQTGTDRKQSKGIFSHKLKRKEVITSLRFTPWLISVQPCKSRSLHY